MNLVRPYACADRRSLGLFRVVLGALLCADLLSRWPLIETLYSNEGVLTNHFALFRPIAPQHLSLFYGFSAAGDVGVVMAITLAFHLLFMLGYRARLMLVLSLVGSVSLHTRNLLAELPSDALLHSWLLWAFLLPVGASFSLDALRRGALAAPQDSELDPVPEAAAAPTVSLAVLGTQLWLIALHAALTLRRSGPLWLEGRALAYALADDTWTTALGSGLARSAPSTALQAASYAAWLSPLVIALLLLVPWRGARRAGLVYMLLYHLGASLLTRDALLHGVLCAAAPLLIATEDWERWIAWRTRSRPELVVIYDADCGVCFLICRLLRRLDGYRRLRFLPNDSPALPDGIAPDVLARTVVVIGSPDNPMLTQGAAVAAVIAALPGGRALSWLLRRPAFAHMADRGYDAFAARRAAVSQWLGFDACGVAPIDGPSVSPSGRSRTQPALIARGLREVGALVLAVLCGYALARPVDTGPRPRTTALDVAVRYARLAPAPDRWAPEPPREAGALVVDGVTPSGGHVDPLTGRAPRVSPLTGSPAVSTPALLAYFDRIHERRYAIYLDGLRDYVKRTSADAEPALRVTAFNIVWLAAPLPVAGDRDAPHAAEVSRTELGAYP